MKKIIEKTLMIGLLLFISQFVIAQINTITIGNGTTSTPNFPVNRYYNYSVSEAIYLKSEINVQGDINEIKFYKTASDDGSNITNVTVYFKFTSQSTLSDGTWSTTGYTQVFTGTVTNTSATGWKTISLNQPFYYNNIDNLSILIKHDYQSYSSNYPQWRYSVLSTTRSRRNYNDYSLPSSLTATTGRADIQLLINTCNKPIANAGVDKTTCNNSSVFIGGNPSATGGSGGYTYIWTPSSGLNNNTNANPSANPTTTTSYSLKVTDGSGCVSLPSSTTVTPNTSSSIYLSTINKTFNACTGWFFDSGTNNNYSNSENYTVTFFPCETGKTLKMEFQSFNTEVDYDYLEIYDGQNISSPLIGTYTGNVSPGVIVAQNSSGSLTFHFYTDNSVTNSGWKALISCISPCVKPAINAGSDKAVCFGNNTVLGGNPTASGGSGNSYSYLWTPSTGLNNPLSANPLANPTVATTYFLKVTDGNYCSNKDTVTVNVGADYSDFYIHYPTPAYTCSGYFYDSGGNLYPYDYDEDYTRTFYPCETGKLLQFNFTSFDLESQASCNYDYMEIYNGPDINSPLIGKFCGSNSPGLITSTHATGALTFKFHSDGSVEKDGWFAQISCVLPSGSICNNSIQIYPTALSDSIHNHFFFQTNNTTAWFKFLSDTVRCYVLIRPEATFNIPRITSISLYSGACDNLNLIQQKNITNNDSTFLVCSGMVSGLPYFIKIDFEPNSSNALNIEVLEMKDINQLYFYPHQVSVCENIVNLSINSGEGHFDSDLSALTNFLIPSNLYFQTEIKYYTNDELTPIIFPIPPLDDKIAIVSSLTGQYQGNGIGSNNNFLFCDPPDEPSNYYPNKMIWKINRQISPNTIYEYSYKAKNVSTHYDYVPPSLTFRIWNPTLNNWGDLAIYNEQSNPIYSGSAVINYSSNPNSWTQIWGVFNPTDIIYITSPTNIDFSIKDVEHAGMGGNDVGIDNIIIGPHLPTAPLLPQSATVCPGGQPVILDATDPLTPFFNNCPFTYLWNTGEHSASITVTNSGTYSVTVTNGTCSSSFTVNVNPGFIVQFNPPISDVSICQSNSTTLDAYAYGGTGIQYSWSPSAGLNVTNAASVVASPLITTTYTVTATNSVGCFATDNVVVTVASPIIATTSTVDARCNGLCNGQATIIVSSGGTAPFQYTINGNTTNSTGLFNNLCQGVYQVYVQDAGTSSGYCYATIPNLTINNQIQILPNGTVTGISCYDDCDGMIALNPLNGTAPYTYLWSSGSTSQPLTSLCPDSYFVTVTDQQGCFASSSYTINSICPIEVSLITAPTCGNPTGGAISSSISGGTTPYSYHWNNSQSTNMIENLSDGHYSLTITDSHGCSALQATSLTNLTGASQWPNLITGSQISHDQFVSDVSTDLSGNVFVTGYYKYSVYFRPSVFTEDGKTAAFLAKYDACGDLLWNKVLNHNGTGTCSYGAAIAIDNHNNVIITGTYYKDINLEDNTQLISSTYASAYVIKYDNQGNFIAATNFDLSDETITAELHINDMAIDSQDKIYIVGEFNSEFIGKMDTYLNLFVHYSVPNPFPSRFMGFCEIFDPVGLSHSGGENVYYSWGADHYATGVAVSKTSSCFDRIYTVSHAVSGNNYPESLVHYTSASTPPDYGNFYISPIFFPNGKVATKVAVNNNFSNDVFITGYKLSSAPYSNVYTSRINADLTSVWWENLSTTYQNLLGNNKATAISVDNSGNAFISGSFNSTFISFDGQQTFLPRYANDIVDVTFVEKFSSFGQHVWANRAGTPQYSSVHGNCVAAGIVRNNNMLYVAGNFDGEAQFNLNLNPAISTGSKDGFVSRIEDSGTIGTFKSLTNDVAEIKQMEGISAYPNPVKDNLFVSFDLKQKTECSIALWNILGQVVFLQNSVYQKSVEPIDMSLLSPGIYFLKINTKSGNQTVKVVKE